MIMDGSSTEEKFQAAVEIIKNLPKTGPIQPSNDLKLRFYSYFKQATEGPCELPKPGFWDIVNRAKWDAWSKLENMSKEEAMKRYVDEFQTIMQETIPKDPKELAEFFTSIGPYIDLVPEEIRKKHGLVNGNISTFLNNNTAENLEACSLKAFKGKLNSGPRKEFDERPPEVNFPSIINGHNINGNESDTDEFSDTLEQVNENYSDDNRIEAAASSEDNRVFGGNDYIVNVRGGGDQKIGFGDGNSPASGSFGARGNRSSRPARSADNPLQSFANNMISGAGGGRRSGGDLSPGIAADANEQLALAVIRLQHIMEQVVVRLDSLEALLTQRQPSANVVVRRSSWSFLGISPKAALLILAWPIIVQWIIYLIKKRNRKL